MSSPKATLLEGSGSRWGRRIYSQLTVVAACIGGFLFGYDTGVISGAMLLIQDDFDVDDASKELIVSITIAGAFLTSLGAGKLSDTKGRRYAILVASVVFVLGSVLLAASTTFTMLVLGRLVVGFGVGLASSVVPSYLAEVAEAKNRGSTTTFMNLSIVVGQVVASIVAGALSTVDGGWRYMLGLAAVPAAVQFLAFYYVMPESPSWLILQGRNDEATVVLRMIRSASNDQIDEEIAAMALAEDYSSSNSSSDGMRRSQDAMARAADGDKVEHGLLMDDAVQGKQASSANIYTGGNGHSTGEVHLMDLWRSTLTRRALLVGCGLQACQQMAGINTIMYYSATLLKLAGFTSNSAAIWLSVVVAMCNLIGSIAGVYCVDYFGRRPLLLCSISAVVFFLAAISVSFFVAQQSSGRLNHGDDTGHCSQYDWGLDCVEDDDCGVCEGWGGNGKVVCAPGDEDSPDDPAMCGSYHYNTPPDDDGNAGWAVLVCLCCYLLAFGPGLGGMPWTINSEIYTRSHRALANSASTSTNWLSNFVVAMTFLSLSRAQP